MRHFRMRSVTLFGSFMLLCALGLLFAARQEKVGNLRTQAALLPGDFSPLRFLLLSKSDQETQVKLWFISLEGAPVAVVEKAWAGRNLLLEFAIVHVQSRFLAFPSRMLTDNAPRAKGTSLFSFYDEEGFPAIYRSARLSEEFRDGLAEAFKAVRGGRKVLGSTGRTSVVRVDLGSCRVGAEYRLLCRSDGGVELLPESPEREGTP